MSYNNYYHSSNERYEHVIYYEVCFKCTSEIYMSLHKRVKGDMVIVHGEKGYNVGFVYREVLLEELQINRHEAQHRFKKILSHLIDADLSMKTMLQSKILAENYALSQCRLHMRGHKLSVCADAVATEFQFDRKKLTVYLKKYEEISVCRLVRRLYDTFKMRIKVIEVDNVDLLQEKVWRYLDVSKLDVTFNEVFSSTTSSTPSSSTMSSTTTSISSTPSLDNNNNNNNNNNNFNNNIERMFLFQEQTLPGGAISSISSSSLPSSITTSPSTTTTSSPTTTSTLISNNNNNNNSTSTTNNNNSNIGWNQNNISNIPYLSQQQPQIFPPPQQLPASHSYPPLPHVPPSSVVNTQQYFRYSVPPQVEQKHQYNQNHQQQKEEEELQFQFQKQQHQQSEVPSLGTVPDTIQFNQFNQFTQLRKNDDNYNYFPHNYHKKVVPKDNISQQTLSNYAYMPHYHHHAQRHTTTHHDRNTYDNLNNLQLHGLKKEQHNQQSELYSLSDQSLPTPVSRGLLIPSTLQRQDPSPPVSMSSLSVNYQLMNYYKHHSNHQKYISRSNAYHQKPDLQLQTNFRYQHNLSNQRSNRLTGSRLSGDLYHDHNDGEQTKTYGSLNNVNYDVSDLKKYMKSNDL